MAKYGVNLKDLEIWETPISIRPLLKRLSLRKGQTKGGKRIHNSIVPLSDNDYEIIAGLEAYSEIEKHSLLQDRAVPSLIEGTLED